MRNSLDQKQKSVHSQESLQQKKFPWVGSKEGALNFPCTQESLIPQFHSLCSVIHTLNSIPEAVWDTGKSKAIPTEQSPHARRRCTHKRDDTS